jgi:beta-lactamase regulating signal transducer with metallopeptidase domain
MEQPSLAINAVRNCGGAPDCRVSQEPGQGALLVVAQRVVQIPHPVLAADEPRQPPRVGPRREENRNAGRVIHDGADHPAISRQTLPWTPPTPGAIDWVPIAIFGVWACGFVAIALIRLRGWLRIRAAVHSSALLKLPIGIEVRSSPGLLEPGVVGLWRPILLLPAGIVERLTTRQLEAVLAHELCHVRRRDNFSAAIHMIVEALFWFHPLVWWIGARLMEERERACDEDVLQLGGEAQVYAEAILNVCKYYLESPLVCVSGITGADLKKRIAAIMTRHIPQKLSFNKKLLLAVAGIAVVVAPLVMGLLNAPLSRAQTTAGRPQFEVASVKPSNSEDRRPLVRVTPGQFTAANVTVRMLIRSSLRHQALPDFRWSGLDELRSLRYRRQAGSFR